jgi:hypothetical protein
VCPNQKECMRHYFFNYETNDLDLLGDFEEWLDAHAAVADPTTGLVYSEERLVQMANDPRYLGGIKIQNPRTRLNYPIVITPQGPRTLKPGQPSPPPAPPQQYVGD